MRVLLIDDHPLIHEILREVLVKALADVTVHSEKSLEGALEWARAADALDLAVLDLVLPGCSRLEALTRFRREFPGVPVVVVSATEDAAVIRAAIGAGARGYIPKTSTIEVMQKALQLVVAGGTYVPQEALQGGAPEAPVALSERQIEVLRLIAKGHTNRRIAAQLKLSVDTVKHHTHEVFRALGVSTRTEALIAAMRRGLPLE